MSSDPPPPQHGSAEPIAAAPAVPISNTAQDTTLSVAPMEQAGPVTGAAGVATFTASASVDAPPSTHAQPDASATAAQAGAPATAAEPATAPAVPAALAIPASGEPATVLPSPVPTPVASVPKPKVKPRKTPIKKSINKLKVDSARNAGVQAQSAPAAESSKMAANRRVMPARLRRVGNLLEGSSLGVELAGLLGDSEAQSSTDQSVALPANARLMITSEHEKYTAKAWEDKEATTSYKSYFDNEDVQRACRERAEIETPDYDSWNEVEFQGRKRTFEPTTDLSVEAYEALQRSSVLREKRQRKLERDRIIKDRTKVADRIDMLKSVESKHFFPIIRARQALQGDTAGPSTASSSALGPAEGSAERVGRTPAAEPAPMGSKGKGRVDVPLNLSDGTTQAPVEGGTTAIDAAAADNTAAAAVAVSSVQTPSAEAVVAGQAFPSELPVPADGSASLAQSPAQAEAQNGDAVIARSESIAANGAIPVEAVEALLNGGSSSHVGEERTATSSASVAAVLPQRNGPSASQPNGSSASLEVPNGITTEAGPSASREAPNGAAPEVDLSTIAAETAAAPTARPKRGRRSKGSNETASSSTSQNPALLAASLSAAAAGTKLSATMSDEAQMMHVSAEQLRKDLMREASEILQKYDAAIAHMSIGLDLVLGEREDGAEATASGAAGGGKAAGSGGGAKASASRPGPRKPRYAESSSEPSDVESSDSPEPAPAAKRQKRGEQAVRGSRHSVSSAKADATMDLDTSVDSIKRKPPAPTTAPAKGARSSARASKGKSRSVADEDPVSDDSGDIKPVRPVKRRKVAIRPPPVRATVSASARQAGIQHDRDLRMAMPLDIPFRTFDNPWADSESESEMKEAPFVRPIASSVLSPNPSICVIELPLPQNAAKGRTTFAASSVLAEQSTADAREGDTANSASIAKTNGAALGAAAVVSEETAHSPLPETLHTVASGSQHHDKGTSGQSQDDDHTLGPQAGISSPLFQPSSPPVSPTTSAPAAPSPSASAIMPEGRLPMNLAFALHPIPYRPKSSSGSEVTAVTAQEEMYVPSPVQTTFPPSTAADPTLQQPQSQGHDALPQEAQPQDLASVQPTAERGSLPRDQHEATAVSAEGQPPTIPPPEVRIHPASSTSAQMDVDPTSPQPEGAAAQLQAADPATETQIQASKRPKISGPRKYRPGSLICVDVPPRPAFHTLVCWGCYPFSSAGLPKDATEDEILRDRGLWTEAQWDARIFGDEGREGERTSEERRAMLLYGWLTPDRRRPAAMKKEEPIEDAAPNEIAATAQSQPPADSQSAAAEPEAALANGSAQTRSQQAKVAPQKGHDFAMQYAQRAEYVNSMLRPAVPQPTRKYETVEETHLHKVAPSLYELSQTHIAYTQQMEKWEADVRAAEPGTAPPPRPEWDLVLRDICSMAKPVKLTKGKGKESAALSSSGPASTAASGPGADATTAEETKSSVAQQRAAEQHKEYQSELQNWQHVVDNLPPGAMVPPKPTMSDFARQVGHGISKGGGSKAKGGTKTKGKKQDAKATAAAHAGGEGIASAEGGAPDLQRVRGSTGSGGNARRSSSVSSTSSPRPTRTLRSNASTTSAATAASAAAPADAPAAQEPGASSVTETAAKPSTQPVEGLQPPEKNVATAAQEVTENGDLAGSSSAQAKVTEQAQDVEMASADQPELSGSNEDANVPGSVAEDVAQMDVEEGPASQRDTGGRAGNDAEATATSTTEVGPSTRSAVAVTTSATAPLADAMQPSLPAAPVGSATVAATEEPAPSAPIETSADTARNAPDSVADADEDTKDVDNSPSKRKRRVPSAFGTRSSSTRIKTLLALGERPPLRELERDEPFDRLMESRLRRWHYLAAVDAGEPSAGSATSAKKCYVPGTPPGSDLGSGRWRMLMQTAREADERWLASCREFDAQKRLEAEGREREEEDDAAEEAAVEEEEEEDDALADSVS